MAVVRRSFIPEPGEELLLSSSATEFATRFDRFTQETGLAPDDVVAHPLCTTPIPVYRKNPDGSLQRFTTVNPAILWHPLFWLPADIALRLQVAGPDGTIRIESDSEWAVRVALEMGASGLYDPESGGWLDILSLHGIDISSSEGYARVQAWVAGGTDPILDSIDLSEITRHDSDPDWAYRASVETVAALTPAQHATTAASLIDTLDSVNPSDPAYADALEFIALLAADLLGDNTIGVDFDPLSDAASDGVTPLHEIAPKLRTSLEEVREHGAPYLHALAAAE